LHHVRDFVGRLSGQKFGSSIIAADGTSLDLSDDSPALTALIGSCLPNQWCRISGWVRGDGALVLIESAEGLKGEAEAPNAKPSSTPPPTAANPAFDCAKAAAAVEFLICHAPDLAALDVELAGRYRDAHARGTTTSHEQAAWIKLRNACGSAQCVRDAYRERIAEVSASYVK
jgi:uncharacterized protein YecT (DUF1311 family)